MGKANRKLKSSLKKYDKSKQNKETLISGELGITLSGRKIVEVPNRKGFVYVRLKGNTSELIQAYNATVSPVYDLPVFVVRQTGIYKVVGRNIDRYQNQFGQAPYLPKHGAQHSFNHEIGVGGDVVWTYSQQFMPLLSYPSGSYGAMLLNVEPHFYEWNGEWKYSQSTGTPDYTPHIPTITGSARMVLSYIDPVDNSIKLVPGTPFSNVITGAAQVAQYIPDIPREIGIPLAAVRLVTGTTAIGWDAVYDVRDFYTVGKPSGCVAGAGGISGIVGWDEGISVGTGTILNVTGDSATLTISGTVLNLNVTGEVGPAGPPGTFGVMAWDEGVPLITGTILNVVGADATLTASGTVLNLSISSPITKVFDQFVTAAAGQSNFSIGVSGSSYNVLKVYVNGGLVSGTSNGSLLMSFNGDTTDANYRYGRHRAATATHDTAGADSRAIGLLVGATATRPKASGHNEITIIDPFVEAYEKSASCKAVIRFATDIEEWETGLEWENRSPIYNITLSTSAGPFASGTHCIVYGYA